MRKFLQINWLKTLLITFITCLITLFTLFGGYTIFAQSEELDDYKDQYHDKMNEFFNKKLEKLFKIMDEEDLGSGKYTLPEQLTTPTGVDIDNYDEKCGEDNLSTFCVSMEALDYYLAYVEDLNRLRNVLPSGSTYTEIITLMDVRDIFIDKEIEESKMVLDAAISAYDEFKLAYPMHKKYESIITNLVKYKLKLKRIKNTVRIFPIKFVDATSSVCD